MVERGLSTVSHTIRDWVNAAPDARQKELRQAVHTVLLAVASFRQAGLEAVMKGGKIKVGEEARGPFPITAELHAGGQAIMQISRKLPEGNRSEIGPEGGEATGMEA